MRINIQAASAVDREFFIYKYGKIQYFYLNLVIKSVFSEILAIFSDILAMCCDILAIFSDILAIFCYI